MAEPPIRVLHVLGTGRAGGVETFVADVVRQIDRDRFEISICITGEDGPVGDRLRAAGAHVFGLGLNGSLTAAAAASFARQVFRRRFEILHVNGGGATLRLLALLAGCRTAVTHVHGLPNEWVEAARRGQPSLNRRLARTYGWGSSRVIVCSRFMERTLLAHCPSLRGRVECILGGVDVERFRPHDGGQGAVVGFIGRLSPEKGADCLLEIAIAVLREEPAARFVVVGDGPLREEAEAAAARCGEGKITLLGERYDVEATLATFDILAVPSDIEAFGLVSLEAMASGRPVVAFDVGGIPEIVVHGETGLLVTPGDTKAFASALLRLLRQPEVRRRMGRAGRARAETLFDVRRTVRSLEALYEAAVRS